MANDGNGSYPQELWDKIKHEWLTSQLSLNEISRSYGPSRAAIIKRARKEGWPSRGTLAEVVRREINTRLMIGDDDQTVTAEVTPEDEDGAIETATRRGVTVVRNHRRLLERLFSVAGVTLDELDQLECFRLESLKKTPKKQRPAMVTAVIKTRTEAMKAVSQVLAQVIPLERQAFSLDKDGGERVAPTYMALDYDKPKESGLSE